jgi:hypothetical protein
MRLGRRQVVDADIRIYVQEVRAVHTGASDGGMRAAVRLPGMRRACPPCPPNRTKLPHRVGRRAPGRRKVRAQHRRIARPAAILARSCWMDQEVETCPEAETCTGERVSARLTDLASRDPANFPQADPIFSLKSMAPVAARNTQPCVSAWRKLARKYSRASNRIRGRSPLCRGPTSENGGRSSRRPASRRSKPLRMSCGRDACNPAFEHSRFGSRLCENVRFQEVPGARRRRMMLSNRTPRAGVSRRLTRCA